MSTVNTTITAKWRRNKMSPLWRLLNQRWNWVSGHGLPCHRVTESAIWVGSGRCLTRLWVLTLCVCCFHRVTTSRQTRWLLLQMLQNPHLRSFSFRLPHCWFTYLHMLIVLGTVGRRDVFWFDVMYRLLDRYLILLSSRYLGIVSKHSTTRSVTGQRSSPGSISALYYCGCEGLLLPSVVAVVSCTWWLVRRAMRRLTLSLNTLYLAA